MFVTIFTILTISTSNPATLPGDFLVQKTSVTANSSIIQKLALNTPRKVIKYTIKKKDIKNRIRNLLDLKPRGKNYA